VGGVAYLFCVPGVIKAETAHCADIRAGEGGEERFDILIKGSISWRR